MNHIEIYNLSIVSSEKYLYDDEAPEVRLKDSHFHDISCGWGNMWINNWMQKKTDGPMENPTMQAK